MGSLCSKSSKYSGGDHVLGPINTNTNRGFQALASPVAPVGTERPDPRTAAAQAAEQRAKAVRPLSSILHTRNFHSNVICLIGRP